MFHRCDRSARVPALPVLFALLLAGAVAAQQPEPPHRPASPELAAGEHDFAEGSLARSQALAHTNRPQQAIERLHTAAAHFAAAAEAAQRAEAHTPTRTAAAALRDEARAGREAALLDAASFELARSSYGEALRDVDLVLLDDPRNAAAQQLRAAIAQASVLPPLWVGVAPAWRTFGAVPHAAAHPHRSAGSGA